MSVMLGPEIHLALRSRLATVGMTVLLCLGLCLALCLGLWVGPSVYAGGSEIAWSTDVALAIDGQAFQDEQVSAPALGARLPLDLGDLPPHVDVVAAQIIGDEVYFVVDVAAVLPGGVRVDSRDVVWTDGQDFAVYFDGSAMALGRGLSIDALILDENNGNPIFSMDTTAEIDGIVVDDEDLIVFDESEGYQRFFDGSQAGVPKELDVNAAALVEGDVLALSFSTGGEIEGITFADEDVLLFDLSGDWGLVLDGSAEASSLLAADLDALDFGDFFPGAVFIDGFESGSPSAWSSSSP